MGLEVKVKFMNRCNQHNSPDAHLTHPEGGADHADPLFGRSWTNTFMDASATGKRVPEAPKFQNGCLPHSEPEGDPIAFELGALGAILMGKVTLLLSNMKIRVRIVASCHQNVITDKGSPR